MNYLLNEEVNEFTQVFNVPFKIGDVIWTILISKDNYVKCPSEQIWLQMKDKDLLYKSRINVPGYRSHLYQRIYVPTNVLQNNNLF